MLKIIITTARTFRNRQELRIYLQRHLPHAGDELLKSGRAMLKTKTDEPYEDVTTTYEIVETEQ